MSERFERSPVLVTGKLANEPHGVILRLSCYITSQIEAGNQDTALDLSVRTNVRNVSNQQKSVLDI
jgi:hypothetical protein